MDFVTSIYLVICVLLVIVILIQQGSGADAGVTFGGGGNTVFGASGADNLLLKITTGLAAAFMCLAVYLTFVAKQSAVSSESESSLFGNLPEAAAPAAAGGSADTATATTTAETKTAETTSK